MSAIDQRSRVLSIQSHVVSGYVGNKSAVFPLQLLGFDVDVINSVHFSNHTGYPEGIRGDVLHGHQLEAILEGLQVNDLLPHVGHILTGYIGSPSFLESVLKVVRTVREGGINRQCRYVCDPVMGDHGKFYVPESLVELYQTKVIPLADVVTPNQFEVEQLTGIKIQTMSDAIDACEKLHDMGPPLVFVTSLELLDEGGGGEGSTASNSSPTDKITILASQRHTSEAGEAINEMWRIDSTKIDGYYTGTGDLTAALLLGHTAAVGDTDLKTVMEKVVGTMHRVISRTHEYAMNILESSDDGDRELTVAERELRLIQSKRDIENPPLLFEAKCIKK